MSEGLCATRGCDDVPKATPVWHGAGAMSRVCPVLSFTPDVEDAIDWFSQTHHVALRRDGVTVRRIGLPRAGGLGDQDARLMEALLTIADTREDAENRLLAKAAAKVAKHTAKTDTPTPDPAHG